MMSKKILKGAVAVGMIGAQQHIAGSIDDVGKAGVVIKGEGKTFGHGLQRTELLSYASRAVDKGEALVHAQGADAGGAVQEGLADALRGQRGILRCLLSRRLGQSCRQIGIRRAGGEIHTDIGGVTVAEDVQLFLDSCLIVSGDLG